MSTILIVDSDVKIQDKLKSELSSRGYKSIHTASNVWSGLKLFEEKQPSVIITSLGMPIISGYEFIQKIRQLPYGQFIPIITLTAKKDELSKAKAYEVGTDTILFKPLDKSNVETLISAIDSHVNKYSKLISFFKDLNKDKTTGLANKATFYALVKQQIDCIDKNQMKSHVISMIDIDNFKAINDSYGHIVGDRILNQVSQIISKNIRSTDIAFRFGGDEFSILLPSTGELGAQVVLDKIKNAIEITKFENNIRLTCSIGFYVNNSCNLDTEVVVHRADQAMYDAKKEGKNCVRKYCSNSGNIEYLNF